ncbi:para-aminobenzoate synthetase component 1 [Methylobacillus rhizosphaerae]|uniref:aminodeoxychorismate synthase n=1 Tax=Methylobacillus rhizosphaerae TaxID=551994 RepID=A0A238YJG4_9PROT|nr:aminodeoxychorismate synthase component I [Methylobacillus rhizosphaerae]SNR71315.1 para-aminobenzoate synthetase component 1 [Methylobacillus rhizosphaerae]
MLRRALPYHADSSALFARIAHQPWAIYLDSGRPGNEYGHYDILVADPVMTLTTRDGVTELQRQGETTLHHDDPFLLLKQVLKAYPRLASDLPFTGGAIGYFGYDLGRTLEKLPEQAQDAEQIPQMMVGIYDWAVVVDHRRQQTWLICCAITEERKAGWNKLCALFDQPFDEPTQAAFQVTSLVSSNFDENTYARAFEKIQRYIHEGDCYQVNLAQRFQAEAAGDAWAAYRVLRSIGSAPFMAFMNLPQVQILSGSPERFLQVKGLHVETRPIKGTRPRSSDPQEDARQAQELLSSLKDRAENLMIVDLLRNDIGKSCAIGSVRADRLFALESYTNVHHLVSVITGKLDDHNEAVDLLRGAFPGGSITGAPKLRAMEIIEELEPNRRGVYCGSIGYIGFDGNMDTNIAIRTAVYSHGRIRFWAGGGIVADSEVDKEYRETWDKASTMLQLVEHFRSDQDVGN